MILASETQFHFYLPWVNARLTECLNLNLKCESASSRNLVTFSVIVKNSRTFVSSSNLEWLRRSLDDGDPDVARRGRGGGQLVRAGHRGGLGGEVVGVGHHGPGVGEGEGEGGAGVGVGVVVEVAEVGEGRGGLQWLARVRPIVRLNARVFEPLPDSLI